MNVPLLDAGGVLLLGYVVILFLVTATVIEAFVMTFMKFNKVGKCFLDAVLLNITSLVIGYFCWVLRKRSVINLVTLYIIS